MANVSCKLAGKKRINYKGNYQVSKKIVCTSSAGKGFANRIIKYLLVLTVFLALLVADNTILCESFSNIYFSLSFLLK